MLDSVPSQHLPDICSAIVKASYTEKIQVLDAIDLSERFKKALPLLMRQIEVIFLSCLRHDSAPGDKNSTRPLVITSEIYKGQALLPKALVL